METETINQILAELEDNLKKLENARTQVNSVSEKSEKMISAFANIIEHLKTFNREFEDGSAGLLGGITGHINAFEKNIDTKSSEISKQIEHLSKGLKAESDETINSLNRLQKEITVKSNEIKNIKFDEKLNRISSQIKELEKETKAKFETTNNNIIAIENSHKEINNRIVDLSKNSRLNTILIVISFVGLIILELLLKGG